MHGKHISYKTQKAIYRIMRVQVKKSRVCICYKKKKNSWVVRLKAFPQLKSGYFYGALTDNDHNSTSRWFFVLRCTKLTTSWLTPQFFKTSFLNFGQFVSSFFTYHSTRSASVIVTHPLRSRVLRTGNILPRSLKWLSVISGWSSKSANPK